MPSATAGAEFSCTVVVGHLGGAAECGGKKKESPTQSMKSTGKVNPEAPGWTRRLRVGRAPPHRAPCPGRVTLLEEAIRRYADKPSDNVVKPKIGMSFDSLGKPTNFSNLYSWSLDLV